MPTTRRRRMRTRSRPLNDLLAELLARGEIADKRSADQVHFWPATIGLPMKFEGRADEIAALWQRYREELRDWIGERAPDVATARREFRERQAEILADAETFEPTRVAWFKSQCVARAAEREHVTPREFEARCAERGEDPFVAAEQVLGPSPVPPPGGAVTAEQEDSTTGRAQQGAENQR